MKKNKIPKTIHYCWFGRGPKSELIQKCIKSWEKYLPDYEIKEWNEDNFDININNYVREAYENKKYAFVSDFARLYAIYNEGGIYFDTDLEVIKNMDEFLEHNTFIGFEGNLSSFTAVFGSVKKSKWVKENLNYYKGRNFVLEDGSFDTRTNTDIVNEINVNKYGVKLNNTYQEFEDFVIYPSEYFSPKDWETGEIHTTKNTYSIHHFNGSWHDKYEKALVKKHQELVKKHGKEIGEKKYKNYYNIMQYYIKFRRVLDDPKKLKKLFKKKKTK